MAQEYPIILDIFAHRGDPKSFIETDFIDGFIVEGDLTARKLRFGVKENASDDDQIITKGNTVDGGSDSQLEATYDGTYTTIVPKILNTDTEGVTNTYNSYEIISISATDATDKVSLFKGVLKLQGDVMRPTDNTGGAPGLANKYFTNEDLIGTKNGVNLEFTVGKVIREYSEVVIFDNTRLIRDTHYSISIGASDTTITIIEGTYQKAPTSTNDLVIDYVEL
jgi:hypothetical protein